jgi:hypothetical protein
MQRCHRCHRFCFWILLPPFDPYYHCHQSACRLSPTPTTQVGTVYSPANIWANLQGSGHPWEMCWELAGAGWQPFFGQALAPRELASMQVGSLPSSQQACPEHCCMHVACLLDGRVPRRSLVMDGSELPSAGIERMPALRQPCRLNLHPNARSSSARHQGGPLIRRPRPPSV